MTQQRWTLERDVGASHLNPHKLSCGDTVIEWIDDAQADAWEAQQHHDLTATVEGGTLTIACGTATIALDTTHGAVLAPFVQSINGASGSSVEVEERRDDDATPTMSGTEIARALHEGKGVQQWSAGGYWCNLDDSTFWHDQIGQRVVVARLTPSPETELVAWQQAIGRTLPDGREITGAWDSDGPRVGVNTDSGVSSAGTTGGAVDESGMVRVLVRSVEVTP